MKFLVPATSNPVDGLTVVGHALDRIDGKLKTTGGATYSYEQHAGAPDAAYGYILGAGIATGHITALRLRKARAAPGVLAIITEANAGQLGTGEFYIDRTLAGAQVDHYHQAIALVVAETFEQARAAAALVARPRPERAPVTGATRCSNDLCMIASTMANRMPVKMVQHLFQGRQRSASITIFRAREDCRRFA